MLSLEKMQKVRIIAPRDNLQKAIDCLYSFGAIQVQECKTAELDLPLAQFEEISSMLIRLRAEERSLGLKGSQKFKEATFLEIRKNYAELAIPDLDSKRKMLSELESKIQELESQKAALLPFRKLNFNPQESKSSGILLSFFEPRPKSEKHLQNALSKIPSEILKIQDDGKNYILLAYDLRQAEKVQAIISKYSNANLQIPQIKGGFKEELKSIEKKIFELQIETEEIREWLLDFVKNKGLMLLKVKEQLKVASLKAELPFKIGKTANFSVVEGWIENKNYDDFENELEKLGSILLEKVKTSEVPPSKLNNPKLIRPFEFMVEFFSLPKSFEIDPTLFIAISFPLFFGMIMGDIGYGLLALFASLAIKLKSKAQLMKRIGGMLALSSISAIFFGVIFGEFFGLEHIFGIELHPLLHRTKEVEELINITLLLEVNMKHLVIAQ
ncbi:MAG: V-type ATPase 116kDa subunit family protein, partial [Candidatus Micrarchaeota archaeon]